jgi:hypothetical protein
MAAPMTATAPIQEKGTFAIEAWRLLARRWDVAGFYESASKVRSGSN